MSDLPSRVDDRAAELRRAFDRSFTEPPPAVATPTEDFLAISTASKPYAIRCAEIAGLIVDKKITPVPTITATLLGIGAFRGAVLPVYSLTTLLGHPAQATPRWIVVAADLPVVLAFDSLDGNLRVGREQILPREVNETEQAFFRDFLQERGCVRPILHLPAILAAIRNRKPKAGAVKEG